MSERIRAGLIFAILIAGAVTHGVATARGAGWLGSPATVHWPGRFVVRGEDVDGYRHLGPVVAWLETELPAEVPVTVLGSHRAVHDWMRYLAYPRRIGYFALPTLTKRAPVPEGTRQALVVVPPETSADDDPGISARKARRALERHWPAARITEPFRSDTGVVVLLVGRR